MQPGQSQDQLSVLYQAMPLLIDHLHAIDACSAQQAAETAELKAFVNSKSAHVWQPHVPAVGASSLSSRRSQAAAGASSVHPR